MSDLRGLSSLSDLSELRELSESSALSELAELSGLNELNELTELIGLGELSELGELSPEWVREVSVPFPFPQPPYQPLAGLIGTHASGSQVPRLLGFSRTRDHNLLTATINLLTPVARKSHAC